MLSLFWALPLGKKNINWKSELGGSDSTSLKPLTSMGAFEFPAIQLPIEGFSVFLRAAAFKKRPQI